MPLLLSGLLELHAALLQARFWQCKVNKHSCSCLVQVSLPFPEKGLVYDYRLDDGGISSTHKSDDDEEDDKKKKKKVCLIDGLWEIYM